MSDGIDEVPNRLRELFSPYMISYQEKLFEAISKLQDEDTAEDKIEAFDNIAAELTKADNKKFSESFIEFHNVARPVCEILYRTSNDTLSRLGEVVQILNDKANLAIPIENSRIKDFFNKGINIMPDHELVANGSKLLRENDVDLRKSTIIILEFFTSECFRLIMDQVRSQHYGKIFQSQQQAEEAIKLLVKYRPRGASDTNEIALEAIQELTSNFERDQRSHIIIVLYTNQSKEEFEIIDFKINSVLFDNAPEFADRIKLCPANLFLMKDFKDALSKLVYQLVINMQTFVTEDPNVDAFFPGTWKNEYVFDDGRKGEEIFKIMNGNQYHILRDSKFVHVFDLDLVSVDNEKKALKFRKVGIGVDKRRAFNDLKMVSKSKYQGVEFRDSKVLYSKMHV